MEKTKAVTLCDPETLCPMKNTKKKYAANHLNHPKWELLDPTPNIRQLFKDFNKKYFDGKIKGVAVVWGKLLDEAGTEITIYHDFHDEVDLYTKQHWWRCNGPCQKWRPNFGLVRKMRNKPPGPSERWWKKHSMECGGTFIKVRKPGDMDAKPVKMVTTGAQKKTSPRPRNCRCKRRAGCSLAPEISDQKSRSTSPCPVCDEIVHLDHLNEHLDQCLETENCKDCIVCGHSIPLKDYEEHVISCADRKFSDNQFKQTSVVAEDYEKYGNKCFNHEEKLLTHDAFKKCFKCDCRIASEDFEKHIGECTALTNCVPTLFDPKEEIANCLVCGIHILKAELHIHLEECDGLLEIFENGEETTEEQNIYGDQCVCPICMKIVLIEDMDFHIDKCIEK
nr:unnamed protein product [Callosobruchus analis]